MQLNVYFLPSLIDADEVKDKTAIVVDVLRATTTITAALYRGAEEIIPCLEIEEAFDAKSQGRADFCGGERGGEKVFGFDLGNSPFEYHSKMVGGKRIAFTTTNGTRAIQACEGAKRILTMSFLNLNGVWDHLFRQDVCVVCSGTNGEITFEDVLCAGALIAKAKEILPRPKFEINDQAHIAMEAWNAILLSEKKRAFLNALRQSRGGKNLIELGSDRDIEFACEIDATEIVGELNFDDGVIRPSGRLNSTNRRYTVPNRKF